jgi:hypothetical protein
MPEPQNSRDDPDFFDPPPEPDAPLPDDLPGPYGFRARLVRINSEAYEDAVSDRNANVPGRLKLNFFPDDEGVINRDGAGNRPPVVLIGLIESTSQKDDYTASFGRIDGDAESELSIILADGIFTLDVNSTGGLFELHLYDRDSKTYVVRELDETKLPDCGLDENPPGDNDGHGPDPDERDPSNASSVVIDLLVVYTAATKDELGGYDGVRGRIALAVEKGNRVLSNSGLKRPVSIRSIFSEEHEFPDYREPPGTNGYYTMLDDIVSGTDPALAGLHALRKRRQADVVTLLAANPHLGGLANVMYSHSVSFWPKAYNVVNYRQSALTYTLIHEIAHNIGCCHETGCSGHPLRYNKGHKFSVRDRIYKTTMVKLSVAGRRIPYFSNPSVEYPPGDPDREPTGTDTRNNARVIDNRAPTVASFSEALFEGA